MKKPFTVVSFSEDTGEIFSDHVEAQSGLSAFREAALTRDNAVTFVVALDGHVVSELDGVTFPGEGLVPSETVLEQDDVFK